MWKNILGFVVIIGAPILGVYLWVLSNKGENGERWAKRRAQGPFVPLSVQEIQEDEQRSKGEVK